MFGILYHPLVLSLDQARRSLDMPARQRVLHRLTRHAFGLIPCGRALVQRRNLFGILRLQPHLEHVRKEMMAPVPAALGVEPSVRPETLAPEVFVRLLRWSARL